MIQSPTEPLRRHLGRTCLVVAVLAGALTVPGAVVFCAHSAGGLTEQWLERFHPVVYLQPEIGEETARKLADEVEEWPSARAVKVRGPDAAWEKARDRLGKRELSKLGVEPGMFPYSLVVSSAAGPGSDVELVSRMRGIETRESVDQVDVPSERVARMLQWLSWGWPLGTMLLLVGMGVAVGLVADYLRRIETDRRRERRILERFGAEPTALERATWMRGLALGGWAGLGAFGLLASAAVGWRAFAGSLWGGLAFERSWHWLVVCAPLLVAPVVGVAIGYWVVRTRPERADELPEGLEPML